MTKLPEPLHSWVMAVPTGVWLSLTAVGLLVWCIPLILDKRRE